MLDKQLDKLALMTIRPKRRKYSISSLGPNLFETSSGLVRRLDEKVTFTYPSQDGNVEKMDDSFDQLESNKQITLEMSLFVCVNKSTEKNECFGNKVCVLGVHGNTGSRMSTISLVEPVFKYGMILAIIDLGGCGNSEGEFVTLGYYESFQLHRILLHLHHNYGIHKFILHGRSMGAASCLLYSHTIYKQYYEEKERKVKEKINEINELSEENKIQLKNEINTNTEEYNMNEKSEKIEFSTKNTDKLMLSLIKSINEGKEGFRIVGMLLDSPYYSTEKMLYSLVKNRYKFVPECLINYVLNSVKNKANGKITDMINGKSSEILNGSEENLTNNHKSKENVENNHKTNQNKKKQINIFSQESKILEINFPVYVLYGLKDDVITLEHTIELFEKMQTENKKLHILENDGHGCHRPAELKCSVFEWLLELHYIKETSSIEKYSKMLGISISDYVDLMQDEHIMLSKGKENADKDGNLCKDNKKMEENPETNKKMINESVQEDSPFEFESFTSTLNQLNKNEIFHQEVKDFNKKEQKNE